MKVLLDTNVIISREAHYITSYSIASLFGWLDKLKATKLVHPDSKIELSKYGDGKLKESMMIKLSSYEVLIVDNNFNSHFNAVIKKYDIEKDRIDNSMLYQVYIGRCDCVITEDKLMLKKARELNINDKVLNIELFLSQCILNNPALMTVNHLPISIVKFGNFRIEEPFFASLKNDYIDFEKWIHKNSNEDAYIVKDKNSIVGMLALKIENENEDYSDINPPLERMKRLKIRTLKVESTGFRLGERLIQLALINAKQFKVKEVYVTVFDENKSLQKLIDLFEKWGFSKHGTKKSNNKEEYVYVKKMTEYDDLKSPRENYPLIKSGSISKFILPIENKYHTQLFPESQLTNEREKYPNSAHRFAIQKVYVSGYNDSGNVKPGDLVLIYRKGTDGIKKYTSVLTTLTVVQGIKKAKSLNEYLESCENRSVFSKEELIKYFSQYKTVIKLLELKTLNKKVILDDLYKRGIIESGSGPRPFHKLTDEEFMFIMDNSKTDL